MTETEQQEPGFGEGSDEVVDDAGRPWRDADAPPAVVYSDEPDKDNLMIPRLRLIQASSKEAKDDLAKAGDWWIDGFDVVTEDDLVVVPLSAAPTRVLFEEFPKSEVLCRSNDGITGYGNPGGACGNCIKAQWTGPKGDRKAPECLDQKSFVMFSPALEMLIQWDTKAWHDPPKFINTWATIHGYRNFAVAVTSFKGRSGAYYAKVNLARGEDGKRMKPAGVPMLGAPGEPAPNEATGNHPTVEELAAQAKERANA